MARVQEAWKLRRPKGHKTYSVRFSHEGRQIERSTRRTDAKEAAGEAAQIYARVISGREAARPPVSGDLATAVAEFLIDCEKTDSEAWAKILTIRWKTHLLPFLGSFSGFTTAAYADYGRARLQKASRPTVRAELCALRRFVGWMAEHDIMLPAVPALPKHGGAGKRAKNARKRQATILTEAEARRILAAMPERSRRTGEFVRPLFALLWETGLRPITVLRLETPLHYVRGRKRLFISREIDKEGFERWVPLSVEARKALDRACPSKPGKLFHAKASSLRKSLESAVEAAGLTHRRISVYDLRHSRISIGANSGSPLAGTAHLVGHRMLSTTAIYTQSSEAAAQAALDAMSKAARKKTRKRAT